MIEFYARIDVRAEFLDIFNLGIFSANNLQLYSLENKNHSKVTHNNFWSHFIFFDRNAIPTTYQLLQQVANHG